MAEATLKKMREKLESSGKGPEICKKTKAIFCFDLKDAGKWTLDLKNEGKLCKGEAGKADCTITMKDADFLAMVAGKLNGQQAFMQGKLKLKGNMMLAQKLGTVLASLKSSRKIHGWHIVCQKR